MCRQVQGKPFCGSGAPTFSSTSGGRVSGMRRRINSVPWSISCTISYGFFHAMHMTEHRIIQDQEFHGMNSSFSVRSAGGIKDSDKSWLPQKRSKKSLAKHFNYTPRPGFEPGSKAPEASRMSTTLPRQTFTLLILFPTHINARIEKRGEGLFKFHLKLLHQFSYTPHF